MLNVQSLADIHYIEVDPQRGRINAQPNYMNVLYTYKSLPFSYETISHLPEEFSHLPIPNIADNYAKFARVTYNFRDRKTDETASVTYFLIQLWDEIDDEFRDVFLMHEISEIQHRILEEQTQKVSHQRAVEETEIYIRRYLTPEEIKRYNSMLEDLPKRRKRRTNVIVL